MQKYDTEVENMMVSHYETLGERCKRYYAGLEAFKLGHGGKTYISKLLKIDKNTIRRGISELNTGKNKDITLVGRERCVGGGRKSFFLPK